MNRGGREGTSKSRPPTNNKQTKRQESDRTEGKSETLNQNSALLKFQLGW